MRTCVRLWSSASCSPDSRSWQPSRAGASSWARRWRWRPRRGGGRGAAGGGPRGGGLGGWGGGGGGGGAGGARGCGGGRPPPAGGGRVGEALGRCPELRLVPPDPDGVRSLWRMVLDRLERIGAACESDREGEAFFEADGLRGIHGGLDGVLQAARTAIGRGARIGCAPGRFSAYAAALRARPRRRSSVTVEAREVRAFLAPLPVGLLRSRAGLEHLPELLERLGIRTLGELATLPPAAVAERFGHPGLLALDLA